MLDTQLCIIYDRHSVAVGSDVLLANKLTHSV